MPPSSFSRCLRTMVSYLIMFIFMSTITPGSLSVWSHPVVESESAISQKILLKTFEKGKKIYYVTIDSIFLHHSQKIYPPADVFLFISPTFVFHFTFDTIYSVFRLIYVWWKNAIFFETRRFTFVSVLFLEILSIILWVATRTETILFDRKNS